VHGYTLAFTVSAALLGLGALVTALLIPGKRRLEELRNAEPAVTVIPAQALADPTPTQSADASRQSADASRPS
jgi:hypothetical protein